MTPAWPGSLTRWPAGWTGGWSPRSSTISARQSSGPTSARGGTGSGPGTTATGSGAGGSGSAPDPDRRSGLELGPDDLAVIELAVTPAVGEGVDDRHAPAFDRVVVGGGRRQDRVAVAHVLDRDAHEAAQL